MISSITIKGFRGIESGQIRNLTKFNVFVGPNNAGKSAVMEALYLAGTINQTAVGLISQKDKESITYDVLLSEPDILGYNPLNLVANKHSDTVESFTLGRVDGRSFNVSVADRSAPKLLQEFELQDDVNNLRFSIAEPDSIALFALDSLLIPEALDEREKDEFIKRADLVKELMSASVDLAYPNRTVFCWHPGLTYYTKGSASWMIEGKPPVAQHTLFCDTSMVKDYVPSEFYRRTISTVSGWTQRIAQHFDAIYEIGSDCIVQFVPLRGDEQKLQGWIAPKDRPALSIDAFGDGARAAFKLLTPLVVMAERVTSDAPGLLIWEEPESFQNPRTLGRLIEEVVKIIRDKPIQVFISTHNLEFVAYITQMLRNKNLHSEDTLIFHLSLSNGQLKSSWFDQDTLVTWLDSGLDPRAWKDFVPPLQFHLKEE